MGFIVAAFFIAQATNVFACNPVDPGYPGNCDDYVFTFSATDNYYAYNNSGCSGSDCDNDKLENVGEKQLFVTVSPDGNFEIQFGI